MAITARRFVSAVAASSKLVRCVFVLGTDPLKGGLHAHVEYLGHASDERLAELVQNPSALYLPAFEEFGMTPVDLIASERPVIAFGKGATLAGAIAVHVKTFSSSPFEAEFWDAVRDVLAA